MAATKASRAKEEATADILPDEVQEQLETWRENLEELDANVRHVVREHPFATLFGAVLGGYLVGRLIARR